MMLFNLIYLSVNLLLEFLIKKYLKLKLFMNILLFINENIKNRILIHLGILS